MKYWLASLIFLAISYTAIAQINAGNYKTKTLVITSDSVLIDTGVIIIGSANVYTKNILLKEQVNYRINYATGYLFSINLPKNEQLLLSYKTIELDFKKPLFKKPTSLQIPKLNGRLLDGGYVANTNTKFNLFNDDDVKLTGSISRGLGFGNNQDVVLNGNLNLQMAGRLNNDIDILAAVSDENNPIQPEGNTQQLQDFDRVFVQLSKNNSKLTVGDFEMHNPNQSYFLTYNKKSRGAQLNTVFKTSQKDTIVVDFDGALSRGRFARNIINGSEGNQGPYRLAGPNGELYIIIISGTEAIYVDGKKLTRGEQYDYVIDYNTGEITFMPNMPITQYSRIVAEFQFSDRNFARSVLHVNTAYRAKNYNIQVNYFTEQDNKNQPLLQTLNDSTKLILANAGDDASKAIINSEQVIAFDQKKIIYRKTDTLTFSNVFVYAPAKNNDSVFYDVKFSMVGMGKGNYIQGASNANGRVFVWVAPVNGIPQGDYDPIIQLVSPRRNQMLTINSQVSLGKNTAVNIEIANSFSDKNTFSTIDKNNDAGYGVKLGLINNIPVFNSVQLWSLQTQASFEFVDANFRYIERYRNVEFDRTWNRLLINNIAQADTGVKEYITGLKTTLSNTKGQQFFYQLGLYNKQYQFNGIQHQTGTYLVFGKNTISGSAEWVNTEAVGISKQTGNVSKYALGYQRNIGKLVSGINADQEKSSFFNQSDTLLTGSYAYNQYSVFIMNADTARIKFKTSYTERADFLPRGTAFATSTVGKTFNTNADWMQKNGNRLSAGFTLRELVIKDTTITALKPEQTALARLEYDYAFLKRVFTANTYYQIGKGQELRRDFQYIEVLVGQGQYVWRDFNEDGSPQLNEFVLAGITDRPQANYIRVFLPTNSFISSNTNQFNQTLNINPAVKWSNKKGFKKIVSLFSNQAAVKLDRKTTTLDAKYFLNPFYTDISDTVLITTNAFYRNTVFFNRSNATFGADLSYQNQRNKTFLTNGFEGRNRTEYTFNTRWNLNSTFSINNMLVTGQRIYSSDFFSTNNFNYHFVEVKPKITIQFSTQIRISAITGYFEGTNNVEYGNQTAVNKELGSELRYALKNNGVINAKLSYYQITFNGDAQSPLGYDMLQGLAVGKNTLWNINFQQRIGSSLQLTINYDGRKAENQRTIHIGRMEARYLF